MAWVELIFAGIFEIGWPIGFKLAQFPSTRIAGVAMAVIGMAVSATLLWLAQRQIPIGTAYAAWTSIGTVGTFLVGIAYFGDSATSARLAGLTLVVIGVTLLKLSTN